MKKLLLTSIALSVIFFLTSAFKVVSEDYFQIGATKWSLDSAEIANESYDITSKFELDLINGSSPLSEAQTFVWISLTSSNTYKMADGVYKVSQESLSKREPFSFSGSVFIDGKEVKIADGTFSVESTDGNISVHMVLKLANGNILNGKYMGDFSFVDRSKAIIK